LIHHDGNVYIGDFIDNKAHGKGVYETPDGYRYEGEWKNDVQEGYGEEKMSDFVYKG